jgi:hypothetical protein
MGKEVPFHGCQVSKILRLLDCWFPSSFTKSLPPPLDPHRILDSPAEFANLRILEAGTDDAPQCNNAKGGTHAWQQCVAPMPLI